MHLQWTAKNWWYGPYFKVSDVPHCKTSFPQSEQLNIAEASTYSSTIAKW